MRRGGWMAWVLGLGVAACSTQGGRACDPACSDADQIRFAHCVAEGLAGTCQAGNRACCAREMHCIGRLDDQTVTPDTMHTCTTLPAMLCERPCTDADDVAYDECFDLGSSACPSPGQGECCAVAQACLGIVGDYIVEQDGCCATDTDCPGATCDTTRWVCVGTAPACGDGAMSATEECDDGNTITESCTYGQMSCTVCDLNCHLVAGAMHYCGDGTIDVSDGETCDPPDGSTCDTGCRTISTAPSCTDHVHNGNETDIDCGGPDCIACLSGESCVLPTDCRSENPTCGGVADCATGICTDTTRCDDGVVCTSDACGVTSGCINTPIDRDGDGEGPRNLDCGNDCNDHDATIYTGAAEVCDGVDQDCDDLIDEMCT